jgi:ubiquinone/menaquinone biosynthesis C-methylase UbiE
MENLMDRWEEAYITGEHKNRWHRELPSQELIGVLATLALPEGATILDAGCGAGTEAVYVAGFGYTVIGVDGSPRALEFARERSASAGVDVTWHEADVLNMPVDAASVDLVTDRGCFHHVETSDRARYAAEMARVLRPGGRLLIRGCRRLDDERFVPFTEEAVKEFFDSAAWTRSAVLPITLDSENTRLEANLVVLQRR